jgi:hypothetical protein
LLKTITVADPDAFGLDPTFDKNLIRIRPWKKPDPHPTPEKNAEGKFRLKNSFSHLVVNKWGKILIDQKLKQA